MRAVCRCLGTPALQCIGGIDVLPGRATYPRQRKEQCLASIMDTYSDVQLQLVHIYNVGNQQRTRSNSLGLILFGVLISSLQIYAIKILTQHHKALQLIIQY